MPELETLVSSGEGGAEEQFLRDQHATSPVHSPFVVQDIRREPGLCGQPDHGRRSGDGSRGMYLSTGVQGTVQGYRVQYRDTGYSTGVQGAVQGYSRTTR